MESQIQLPGILVLSEDSKAMIFPKVASTHPNIINPASGMMVYDIIGTAWTFWKP